MDRKRLLSQAAGVSPFGAEASAYPCGTCVSSDRQATPAYDSEAFAFVEPDQSSVDSFSKCRGEGQRVKIQSRLLP
jgi:hypothetical protein